MKEYYSISRNLVDFVGQRSLGMMKNPSCSIKKCFFTRKTLSSLKLKENLLHFNSPKVDKVLNL